MARSSRLMGRCGCSSRRKRASRPKWSDMGIRRRIKKFEEDRRPEPEDERERQKWRERIRETAEQSIERSQREGKEPVFEIEGGDVFCAHDGKPVTEWHQTL